MASTPVGGLHVEVKLDVQDALRQLEKLQAQFRKTLSAPTGKGGGAAVALDKVTGAATGTDKALGKVNKSTRLLKESSSQLGRSLTLGLRNPLYAVQGVAGSASKAMKSVGAASGAMAAGLTAVAVAAVAVVAAGAAAGFAIFKLGKIGFNAAKDLERLNVSMRALFQETAADASKSRAEVEALIALAIESPFLTDTIIQLDKFLISQGVVAGKMRGGLISAVLDLSAALGLTDDNLGGVSYALAQVQSRGILSGDELRQLANQLIPVYAMLSELPEFAGQSAAAIRKEVEKGNVTSQRFFEAFIGYAGRYESAAAAAALTTEGLIDKFKDIISFSFGQAFIDVDQIEGLISPLEVFRSTLEKIVLVAQEIDFRPLAASMGYLMQTVIQPLSDFVGGSGQGIVGFFQHTLPNAIATTANVFSFLGQTADIMVDIFWEAFGSVWDSFKALLVAVFNSGDAWRIAFQLMAVAVAVSMAASITLLATFAGALGTLIGVVRITIAAIKLLFAFISGNAAAGVEAYNEAIDGATATSNAFFAAVSAPAKAITTTVDAVNALGQAFEDLKAIELPKFTKPGDGNTSLQDSFENAIGGAGGVGGDGGKGAAKTVSELNKAMDVLWDLSQRWYGLRSDLEKGFLGTEGFTATIDQIVAMGKKVTSALITLGREDVASAIAVQTFKLIELADKRNEITAKLADSEKNLKKLVDERDRFTAAIRRSAIDFAAALKLEEETVRDFALQSERGFFIESETKSTKSFVDSLRERSIALDEFFANIKQLQASGLDEDLLQDLLTAGPQASGEVAKAIAEGGDDMIKEINVLYGGISDTADGLADFGAEQFHDAGISQVQGLVDGLTEDLSEVEASALAITALIYETVQPFAKEMEDLGKAGSGGLASGLASGAGAVSGAAGGLGNSITGSLSGLPGDLATIGEAGTFEIEGFMGDWIDTIYDGSEDMLAGIDELRIDIENSLKGLKIDIGADVNIAALRYKFFDALLKMFQDIPVAVRLALFGPTYYAIERGLSAARGSGGYTSGSSSSGGGYRSGSSASGSLTGLSSAYAFTAGTRATGLGTTSASVTSQGYGVPTREEYTPTIKVFIGDQELRGMVKTEIVYNEHEDVKLLVSGRRN